MYINYPFRVYIQKEYWAHGYLKVKESNLYREICRMARYAYRKIREGYVVKDKEGSDQKCQG